MTMSQQDHNAPDLDFRPAFAMSEAYELEKACQNWAITRRVATCLATQSRDDLTASLLRLNDSDEGDEIIELLESMEGLIEHHKQLGELYESIQARLFISTHDAFGIPLSDTEPTCVVSSGDERVNR